MKQINGKGVVMSLEATLVLNPCNKFKLDPTNRPRVRTTTIFH